MFSTVLDELACGYSPVLFGVVTGSIKKQKLFGF